MDIQLLEDIGLTKPQAAAYAALIAQGASTAPEIAAEIGESRSNAYKVLDKLDELGLATKDQNGKKIRYFAVSPVALEQFVQRQAAAAELRERKLKAALPSMLDFFSTHSEQAGIRYFQGKQGLLDMYKDQLKTGEEIYFIRADRGLRHFGFKEEHRVRNLFPAHGIRRYGITQDVPPAQEIAPDNRMPMDESDKLMLLTRTWIYENDYNAPVEWYVYGNKLAILSFGQESTGIIIESAQIADAFRQLYRLIDSTIRLRPDYGELPKINTYTAIPMSESVKRHLRQPRADTVASDDPKPTPTA